MAAKGYRNAEVDDLADRQLVTLELAERKALVARIQQLVPADLPLLHLYYPAAFLIFKKSVFDQWNLSTSDKQVLVTGAGHGGHHHPPHRLKEPRRRYCDDDGSSSTARR